MTTPTRFVRIVVASAVLAVLVSCSSGGSDEADSTTTTKVEKTTTTEATTTTEEETTTTEAGDDPSAQLATLLITADDLGPTFVEREANDDGEGPCGGKVDDDFPPAVKAQAAFQSDELQLAMQQDLRVFESEDAASAAYDGFVAAVSCGSDTADGSLQLGEPTDVTNEVGQKATAVTITAEGSEGVGVVVHYSDLIATYQFQGATGAADAAGIGSPLDFVKANIAEIVDTID